LILRGPRAQARIPRGDGVVLEVAFRKESPQMSMQRRVVLFVVFAAALGIGLGGCVKFKQDVKVHPDGSGKIDFRIGFNKKGVEDAAAAMGQGGGDGMEDPTKLDMSDLEDMRGFVAFTTPKEEEKDGWKFVSFTGYFEDINKVELGGKEEGEAKELGFVFAKTDAGFSLKAQSQMKDFEGLNQMGDMGGDGADMPPEMKGMMESMKKLVESLMEGFEFEQNFTMPGAITKATGVTSQSGRTAAYVLGPKDVKDPKLAAELSKVKEFAIECGASEVTEADLASFKAELAKAKEEWAKMKAEAEKNAPKEPDEPKDDGGDEGGEDEGEGTK
jgi:hypothetical protein